MRKPGGTICYVKTALLDRYWLLSTGFSGVCEKSVCVAKPGSYRLHNYNELGEENYKYGELDMRR